MKILKVGLIMATIAFMMAGAANANLVTNEGFETGDTSGWIEIGTTPSSLYVADFNPHSGIYHVTTGYSEGFQFITQNITTTPGQSYTVGFWLSNGDASYNNEFVARWDGVTKISLSNLEYNSPDYTYYNYTAVATGNSTTIAFGFGYNPGWFDFDDVSMNAVPIPGAIWLLGSGLVGLIGVRRKLKK
jgi:hypothetical protein